MPITVEGTRFGTIELADDAIVEFPAGIIGLASRRWALVAREEDTAFRWLQSIDDPELAMPVVDPTLFFPDYAVSLSDEETNRITGGATSGEFDADVYVTVRAAERTEDFRANLLAPLLLVGGRGWQVLNDAPGLSVSAPLFEASDAETA